MSTLSSHVTYWCMGLMGVNSFRVWNSRTFCWLSLSFLLLFEGIRRIFSRGIEGTEIILFNWKGNVYEKNGFWKQVITGWTSILPGWILTQKNVHFKVIATFEETELEATEHEIELSAIQDASDDFLYWRRTELLSQFERFMNNFKRGQIRLVNFDPSFRHEYKKVRPALIIQNDEYIASSDLLTVIPISSEITKQTELDILLRKDAKNRLMTD